MEATELGVYLAEVSGVAMPKGAGVTPRMLVFWWSGEIARLRNACVKSLRAYQRAGRKGLPRESLGDIFRVAKKRLYIAIRVAQARGACGAN